MAEKPVKKLIIDDESYYFHPDARQVAYSGTRVQAANVSDAIDSLYETIFAQPEIYLNSDVIYTSLNEEIKLEFSVSVRGTPQVTVKQGTNVIFDKKVNQTAFIVSAGRASIVGDTTYTIIVSDSLGNTVEATILNRTIEASTKFIKILEDDEQILSSLSDQIIGFENEADNNYFSLPSDCKIRFQAQGANPTEVGLEYSLDGGITKLPLGDNQIGGNLSECDFEVNNLPIGSYSESSEGTGTILFYTYMKIPGETEKIYPSPVQIKYYLVEFNTIRVEVLNDLNSFTSNDNFELSYKVLYSNNSNKIFSNVQISMTNLDTSETKTITRNNLSNNVIYIDSFGIVPYGDYQIDWIINDDGEIYTASKSCKVEAGEAYISNNLMAYFTATDSNLLQENSWIPYEGSKKSSGLKFNLSGGYEIREASTGSPKSLHLQPNAFGELSHSIASLVDENCKEFSLELYYKNEDIGELQAPVITSAKESGSADSLILYHNKAYIGLKGESSISTNISNNKWNHVVFVIAQAQTTPAANIEDNEYYNVVKIYLNGCVVSCQDLKNNFTVKSNEGIFNLNFVLNGYLNNGNILNSGNSYYSLIRIYDKALLASEVLRNYQNAISYDTSSDLYTSFIQRAANTSIAKIFFIKNKETIRNKTEDEFTYVSFSQLHTIKKKKPDKEQSTGYFSKTSAVNCTAYLIQEDTITKYPNMDVYLQGTSSLEYPIKNYQVKNYGEATKKSKFLPTVREVDGNTGKDWGGVEGDYVYTLKCDYMEHSHKNNTPTAQYYDTVLNAVGTSIGNNNWKSPAKQAGEEYRDSITGFPIIVYYSDNEDTSEDLTEFEAKDASNVEKQLILKCSNTGSYMFNIDKEGKALGFEIEELSEETETFDFPLEDYYLKSILTYDNNIINCEFEDTDAKHQFSTSDDLNLYVFNNTTYKVISLGKLTHINGSSFELLSNITDLQFKDNEFIDNEEISYTPLCVSIMKRDIARPISGYCVSLEGTANSQDKAAATFYTVNEANQERLEKNENLSQEEQLEIFNKFEYYATTLEPRYSYADEEEYKDNYGQDYQYCCEYEKLEDCIKFFKVINLLEQTNKIDSDIAKSRFKQLFSLEYCLTYYLQMLMFIQVDNAGKNAMFDSWGGSQLYPRPYDMDTQMGLDNVGKDIIPISAELVTSEKSGDTGLGATISWRYKGEGREKDENAYRLTSYNTRNSRLWNFIAKYYHTDINNLYNNLRANNIYSEQSICNFVNGLTSNIISESQYNKDAVLKYLLPPTNREENGTIVKVNQTDYFYVLAGGRVDRYQQIIRERLIFLDSVFELANTYTSLYFRAQATSPNNIISLNIGTSSPQYVSMISGNGKEAVKFYVSPNSTYCLNPTEEESKREYQEGILLTYNNQSTDRETWLYGFNNIKLLRRIGTALPSILTGLNNGTKLNSFELNVAPTSLESIDLSGNTKLNNVSINNCPGVLSISLSNATGLKDIEITNNESLTSITLPKNAPITNLNLSGNRSLQSLTLENLPNLTSENLNLSGCRGLKELIINGCPLLANLDLSELPSLTKVTIINCPTLIDFTCERHENLTELTIQHCNQLQTINLSYSVLQTLNLGTGLNNLQSVDLNNSTQLTTITLPTNTNKDFSLNLTECIILSKINSTIEGVYNFENIKIVDLKCKNNDSLIKVTNLIYDGKGSYIYEGLTAGMFENCSNLQEISNSKFNLKSSMDYMFAYCSKLKTISYDEENKLDDVFTMSSNNKITTMRGTFYQTPYLDIDKLALLKIFAHNNDELTNLSSVFSLSSNSSTTNPGWNLQDIFLGKNLTSINTAFYNSKLLQIKGSPFKNCTKLTNVHSAFGANSKLTAVSNNLLYNCTKINDAAFCFADTKITKIPVNLLSKELTQSVSIIGIFSNTSINSNDGMKDLFNNPNITKADRAFSNTKITTLPEFVLEGATGLTRAIGLFSNCTELKSLPERLWNDNKTYQNINLSGLFYNCNNLAGKVPNTLFKGNKEKITHLGSSIESIGTVGTSYMPNYVLGAFANTQISCYDAEAFQGLTNLKDISYLFAQATVKEILSNNNNTYTYRIRNKTGEKYFTGFYSTSGETFQLNHNMFKGSQKINKIVGAFMGTKIQYIEMPSSLDDPSKEQFLQGSANNITDISLLFNNSDIIDSSNEPNKNGLSPFITSIGPKIKNAQYSFASSNIKNPENILKSLPILENATGMFAQTETETGFLNIDTLSNNDLLSNTSFMFAGTNIEEIGSLEEDSATTRIITDFTINFYNSQDTLVYFLQPTEQKDGLIDTNEKILEQISINSEKELIFRYKNSESQYILTDFNYANLSFSINEDFNISDERKYEFYGSPITNTDINNFIYSLSLRLSGINQLSTQLCTKDNFSASLICIYKQISAEVKKSLLYGKKNITSTSGMFMDTNLVRIPKYIFASNEPFNKLTNISYMFANCTKCNENDNTMGTLIPASWLNNCIKISNISGLFANLGSEVDYNENEEKTTTIGTAFNSLSEVTNASAAFANIPVLLSNTELTNNFLYNSVLSNKLTNCSYLFSLTPITSFNLTLNGTTGIKNKINNLQYAFAYAFDNIPTNNGIYIIPAYTQFPITSTSSIEQCWVSANKHINNNNHGKWPTNSYTKPSGPSVADEHRSIKDNINEIINTNTEYSKICNYASAVYNR